MNYNQDIWRTIKEKITAVIDASERKTAVAIDTAVSGATKGIVKGKADDLPAAADFIGQLFIKTGATNPGLYAATGTATPGWKAVSLAV